MSRPVIGIVSSLQSSDPNLNKIKRLCRLIPVRAVCFVCRGLLDSSPADSDETIIEMANKVDGYRQAAMTCSRSCMGKNAGDRGRSAPNEIGLTLYPSGGAHAEQPIFGICRGIQAINVAFGGTLYQDIRREETCTVNHYQDSEASARAIGGGPSNSILYPILGQSVMTNSFHHQAVKRVADGF